MQFRRGSALVLALMVAVPAARAAAQDALVLSGGGSRGLAHIGVLLYLYERGFDPDVVVGSSMGAVIGALYAAGLEPDEIRRRAEAVGWGGIFGPMPVLSGPAQVIRTPMLSFDLDVPERRINRGVFGEWRVNRALARLLFDANSRARSDFDRLPRRYRALAADLTTGEPVVIERGDLARAVRASMAYPGLFASVKWNDVLLIDGGIVDNLPTLEARALGATFLVAVDVARPDENEVSRTPLAVVQRALNLMLARMHRDTVPPDVLVRLNVNSNFAAASFPSDPKEIIKAGYDAAATAMAESDVPTDGNHRMLRVPPDSIGAIVIEAPDLALGTLVAGAFASLVGTPYDAEAVLDAMDVAYSAGLLHGVWPRIELERDSAGPATLRVLVDATAPSTVSMAAGYDNDRGGRVWASLDNYTRFGHHPVVRTAAFSVTPIERWVALSARSHWVVRPGPAVTLGAHLQERVLRSFDDDLVRASSVWRGGGWISLDVPTGLRSGFVTVAIRGERIDAEEADGVTAIGPVIRFAQVPSETAVVGEPLVFEGEARAGDVTYARFAARGSVTFNARLATLAVMGDARAGTRDTPPDDWPALGDDHAVPGLRWGELRGRARVVAGVDGGRRIGNGITRIRLRTGAVGRDLFDMAQHRWITGARFSVAWPIPLGTVEVGWGVSSRSDSQFTVDLGRAF